MPDVPPQSDQGLNAFAANFDTKITATPTAYGLVAADATAYHALATDYATRLATAVNPATRTKVTVAAKNTSKAALVAKTRTLAKVVNAYPPITNAQRAELGLNLRDSTPTPIPPPATRPIISFDTTGPLVSKLRIADELSPSSRAKPSGAIGCEVWVKIGGTAPISINDCRYEGLATRNQATVEFPAGSGNQTCYAIGRWINERGQVGPASNVVSATIAA